MPEKVSETSKAVLRNTPIATRDEYAVEVVFIRNLRLDLQADPARNIGELRISEKPAGQEPGARLPLRPPSPLPGRQIPVYWINRQRETKGGQRILSLHPTRARIFLQSAQRFAPNALKGIRASLPGAGSLTFFGRDATSSSWRHLSSGLTRTRAGLCPVGVALNSGNTMAASVDWVSTIECSRDTGSC